MNSTASLLKQAQVITKRVREIETYHDAAPIVALADAMTIGAALAHAATLTRRWIFPCTVERHWPALDALCNTIVAHWLPGATEPDSAALVALLQASADAFEAANDAAKTNSNPDCRAIANGGVALLLCAAIQLSIGRAALRFIARETLARVGADALAEKRPPAETTTDETAAAIVDASVRHGMLPSGAPAETVGA